MKTLPFLPEHFAEISTHLQRGSIVIFPTESSYGFSGDIKSVRAIRRVEEIKKRKNKAFLCLVAEQKEIQKWGNTKYIPNDLQKKSLDTPITWVLSKTTKFTNTYPLFFPEYEKIGIRNTLYKPLEGFLSFYPGIIFSTSANISGQNAIYSEEMIRNTFEEYPDILFVSAGTLEKNSASQIIDVEKDEINILRK